MPELLIEILSEEIPARMQARATDDLKRLVMAGLKDSALECTGARAFVTPRRLVLVVDDIPAQQPDISEEKRGPKIDAPARAVNGFKGSLPENAVIERRETPKGTFFYATIDKKGGDSFGTILKIITDVLYGFPWPKSMKWGNTTKTWVRPIHNILVRFGGLEKPAMIYFGSSAVDPKLITGLETCCVTYGHRFLAPDAISVENFADYRQKLFDAKVMLDPAERRAKIETDAGALAETAGVTLKNDPGLLAEVTGLVEWPVVLMGTIEDRFMALPDEVLISSMRGHQKYFACLGADGALANRFIVVANTETADAGAQIIAGNERVLRARLSDAGFFWDQDRARTLESRVSDLKDRVFHAKLGTMQQKIDRVQALADDIAGFVPGADRDGVRSATRLAKADLSTGMVGEFPELQGVMGRYYALHDGAGEAVANAIAEHYSPLGPNDTCPDAPISICVALADKIDSLVSFFAIGEKPTGSKDPFALRRAALGVIRLILENDIRMPLAEIFMRARQYGADDADYTNNAGDHDPTGELQAFFADRLKVHLKERGTRHDLIDCVFSRQGEVDLVRLIKCADALQAFLGTEDGQNLLAGWRRAANILTIEEKKDGRKYDDAADASGFESDQERILAEHLTTIAPSVAAAITEERFADAMQAIAGLRAPIDAFFDKVTVNTDDPTLRVNRLKLLNGIRSALVDLGDFSRIED